MDEADRSLSEQSAQPDPDLQRVRSSGGTAEPLRDPASISSGRWPSQKTLRCDSVRPRRRARSSRRTKDAASA